MKKLILAGGGNAHVTVLEKLKKTPVNDVETILISPDPFQYYAEMFAGYAEGIYDKEELRINLKQLASDANVIWQEDAVTAIDPKQKKLLTAKGEVLQYDAVSFDIGTLTADTDVPGVQENTYKIKPNYRFPEVIDDIRPAGEIVIIGGGVAAIEIAFSIKVWRTKHNIKDSVVLVSEAPLLRDENLKTSKNIESRLLNKDIQVLQGKKIETIEGNRIRLAGAEDLPFDKLIWMPGSKAPSIFKLSHLPVDEAGYLKVEETLQVKKYPSVFGAGECTSHANHKQKLISGGHAEIQGPVLFENLKGFFESGTGQLYHPRDKPFSILSTGNKTGLLIYKRVSFSGYWPWLLKNTINKRFVKKYQQ